MGSQQTTVPDQNLQVGPLRTRWTAIASPRRAIDLLTARLFAPVDIASIVIFRIAFGLIMLWEVDRYLSHGWVASVFIDPVYHFPYRGFEWVKPWPGPGMNIHFYALAILAVFIAAGFMYRISAALFFLGFTYVFLLEKANYLNHLYLAALISFLMIFVPANRALSLDVLRRPEIRSNTAPTWALVLLTAQFSFIYVYGGLAKLNWDWLHGNPLRIWMAADTDMPVIGRWFTEEWMVYLMSYSGLLLDLFIVPLLLWSRTRWLAVIALVLFHRMNAEMFSIGIFPTFATAAIILFLPPSLPRRVASALIPARSMRWGKRKPQAETVADDAGVISFAERPLGQRLTVAFVVAYLAVQMLVPLRHFLYPGNPAWTDEGDRFAWRMMLHSKVGEVTYEITDPATGETWEVAPEEYLTSQQVGKLVGQPDMILLFSHFLADEWRARGYDQVEVRARTMVSLNGREPVPIVDPTVDLAAENLSILPADWITSLDEQMRIAREAEEAARG